MLYKNSPKPKNAHILKTKKKSRWSTTFFSKMRFRAFCSESIFPFFSFFFFFCKKTFFDFFDPFFSGFSENPKILFRKKKKIKEQ